MTFWYCPFSFVDEMALHAFAILRREIGIEFIRRKIAAMKLRLMPFVSMLLAMTAGEIRAQDPPAREHATPRARRKLEVDDYYRIKDVADAQISSEGKWVAYTVK